MGCYLVLKAKGVDLIEDILLEVDANALFTLIENGLKRSAILGIFADPRTAHYVAVGELFQSVSHELGFDPCSDEYRKSRALEKASIALERIASDFSFLKIAENELKETGVTKECDTISRGVSQIEDVLALMTKAIATLQHTEN